MVYVQCFTECLSICIRKNFVMKYFLYKLRARLVMKVNLMTSQKQSIIDCLLNYPVQFPSQTRITSNYYSCKDETYTSHSDI